MVTVDTLVGSPASFMSSTHLIAGDHDAILVDASFAKHDAAAVVDWVKASGKRLRTVFITHAHPDHFLGLPVILEAFPQSRAVAIPPVAAEIGQVAPQYHATFVPVYGDDLAADYTVPEPLDGLELDLEGETLPVMEIGPGEANVSSALSVPSIQAIATGDQIFSGIHVWLVEYRPQGSLEGIEQLRQAGPIRTVLPGHGPAGGPELLEANERYIREFMSTAAAVTSKDEGVAAMSKAYPDYQLPVILDFGMQAAVEGRSYPDIMRDYLNAAS